MFMKRVFYFRKNGFTLNGGLLLYPEEFETEVIKILRFWFGVTEAEARKALAEWVHGQHNTSKR